MSIKQLEHSALYWLICLVVGQGTAQRQMSLNDLINEFVQIV